MPKKRSLRIRLMLRLAPQGKCLVFTGYRNKGGYGQITDDNGKKVMAHRAAYELYHGPIPEGLDVLHRCDNPPCCLDEHLFLGTDADNAADRNAKGRQRAGMPRKEGPEGTAWCCVHQDFLPRENFHKDRRRWNRVKPFCKTCYAHRRATRYRKKRS